VKRPLILGVLAVSTLLTVDASAKVTIIHATSRTLKTPTVARRVTTEAASREKWIGTKAILRDDKTGKLRKPTEVEIAQLVKTIRELTTRPVRTEAAPRSGSVDTPYAQVVLARATEDGGMETLCVQTFDEAANFLGLVQQVEGSEQ
jgi:hypothetical protein